MGTFRLRVTGISTVVPELPWDETPQRFCALMPDLRPDPARSYAAGGTPPVHHGMLRIQQGAGRPPARGADGEPGETRVLYLDRHRVFFSCDDEEPADDLTLSYSPELDKRMSYRFVDLLKEDRLDDVAGILSLPRVIPPGTIDETALHQVPNQRVLAQVLFGRTGTVFAETPSDLVYWRVPTLAGAELEIVLSKTLVWKVEDVDRVTVELHSLDRGGDPIRRTLSVPEAGIEVTALNVCRDNPLEWDIGIDPTADQDFAWHYDLLTPDLVDRVRAEGAPVPVATPEEGAVPSTFNCNPGRAAASELVRKLFDLGGH